MPSGGGSSKTVSQQKLPKEARELMKGVIPVAQDYLKTPLQLPNFSTIPDLTPEQLQGREMMQGAFPGISALSGQGIGQILSNLGGFQAGTNATGQGMTGANALMHLGARGGTGITDLLAQGGAGAQALQTLLAQGAAGAGGLEGLLSAGGQGSANLGNLTQAGGAGLGGLGAILSDYASGAQGRNLLQSGALLDPATNPVLQAQIQGAIQPLQQTLTEDVLPGIRSQFIGGNTFGGSRQGIAEGRAIDAFTREAGNVATNLQANNFNQGLGAMLSSLNQQGQMASSAVGQGLGAAGTGAQAGLGALGQGAGLGFGALGQAGQLGLGSLGQGVGQALGALGTGMQGANAAGNSFSNTALQSLLASPQLSQLALLPGMVQEGIGESGRQIDAARLSELAQRFTTQQMLPFLQAQDVAQLASSLGGGSAVTTSSQESSFDPATAAAGAGSFALGMAKLLPILGLSDERVKTKVKPLIKLGEHNWYSYELADRPGEMRLGVMAQEAEKISPDAVFEFLGVKMVNYDKLYEMDEKEVA